MSNSKINKSKCTTETLSANRTNEKMLTKIININKRIVEKLIFCLLLTSHSLTKGLQYTVTKHDLR